MSSVVKDVLVCVGCAYRWLQRRPDPNRINRDRCPCCGSTNQRVA